MTTQPIRDPNLPTWFYTSPHKPMDLVPWLVLTHERRAYLTESKPTPPTASGGRRPGALPVIVIFTNGERFKYASIKTAMAGLKKSSNNEVSDSIRNVGAWQFEDGSIICTERWLEEAKKSEFC